MDSKDLPTAAKEQDLNQMHKAVQMNYNDLGGDEPCD
jgi:hypothetical protein